MKETVQKLSACLFWKGIILQQIIASSERISNYFLARH